MKLLTVKIHNFRSILDVEIIVHNFLLLVGANNAGKSTIINALRAFYDDLKWKADDFPRANTADNESWVQLKFRLDDEEWKGLADEYKEGIDDQSLTLRRYFRSDNKSFVQKDQSNIFGFIKNEISEEMFYSAKNLAAANIGQILYVPALTTAAEQTKTSGPSPLRNMLNYLLDKVVSKSDAYKEMITAFENLNKEARGENGFLNEIARPLNKAISNWNIKIDISVNSVQPQDISKSLVKFDFIDSNIGNENFELESFGHGFQRSVIYELLSLAPTFKNEKKTKKKGFNPTFNLILFEEPEAFLHPTQQENLAYHLRRLADEDGQQVIITTHSQTIAGKAAEKMKQLVRVQRTQDGTKIFQPNENTINEILNQEKKIQAVVNKNQSNFETHKQKETELRFQLWLDGERSSLFFADKVLLVEGSTERGLFNYLLATKWNNLREHHICVVDVLGKYNFPRYMELLKAYGISHGIIFDDDMEKNQHRMINKTIENSINRYTLAEPEKLKGCLETFLGLSIPKDNYKKDLEILKALTEGKISDEKLQALQIKLCNALAINIMS